MAGHEAGAIEYTGHKVLGLPHENGKLAAATVREFCQTFFADGNHDHMVFPGMVYISHPTEYGTLYTKAELEALAAVCREFKLPLFLDGARLGYGLVSEGTDVTLADLARLTHQGGCALWRGRGLPPRRTGTLHDHGQAAGCAAGQGASAGLPRWRK